MPRIALVTVNYNNAACTRGLLDNLREHGKGRLSKVIVVDNASAVSDYEQVHAWVEAHGGGSPHVALVRNRENLGYFRGLNRGLEELDRHDERVVVCNNDLLFAPDFFTLIARQQWEDDVLVVAPDVVTLDGTHQNPHAVRRISWFRKFSYAIYFSNYWAGVALLKAKRILFPSRPRKPVGPRDIYMGIGACYILTPSFFLRCGRLDDRVFLWGEEPLLANQVQAAGGRTIYSPDLRVTHLERQSTGSVPRRSQYLAARNSYKIYRPYL